MSFTRAMRKHLSPRHSLSQSINSQTPRSNSQTFANSPFKFVNIQFANSPYQISIDSNSLSPIPAPQHPIPIHKLSISRKETPIQSVSRQLPMSQHTCTASCQCHNTNVSQDNPFSPASCQCRNINVPQVVNVTTSSITNIAIITSN